MTSEPGSGGAGAPAGCRSPVWGGVTGAGETLASWGRCRKDWLAGRLTPQLFGVGHDLTVGGQIQLLLNQRFVDPCMPQRAVAIVGRHQRLHQPERNPAVERILGRGLAPPLHRFQPVPARLGLAGQLPQRLGVAPRQARPLLLDPAVELRCPRQTEAVKEGAGVPCRCVFQLPSGQRRLELRHVARDQLRVEPELAGAEKDVIGPEILAQGIERLIEYPPRPLLLGVGPEVGEHLVAGEPLLAGGGKKGQDGQPARLRGRAAYQAGVSPNVQSAESVDPQHDVLGYFRGMAVRLPSL